jgi:hypothetical protein
VREAILVALSRIAIDEPAWRVRARHRVRREIDGGTASMRKAAIVLLERMYGDDDPPPVSVVDELLGRLEDEHPEVRVVAAAFLARHLEPGFTGAATRLRVAIERGERTVSLLCLDALVRHRTEAARGVVAVAARGSDDAVATRGRALLEAWPACVPEWHFARRAGPATAAAPSTTAASSMGRPSMTPSQRPTRVRVADDSADVVEARDPSES